MAWHGRLARAGVPIPALLAFSLEGERPWMLLERLPGRDLLFEYPSMTDPELLALAAEMAAVQRKVALLPRAGGYGFASDYGDPGLVRSWEEVVMKELARSRRRLESSGACDTAVVDAVARRLPVFRAEWERIAPVAFLDDTTTKNVIVHRGRLSGIVDTDTVCFGDPLYTLGLTRMALLSAGLGTAYVDHWADCLGLDSAARARVELYTAVFCVEFPERAGPALQPRRSRGGRPGAEGAAARHPRRAARARRREAARVIAAVLFDLDDTLVAFDAVTESSWRAVIASWCEGRAADPHAVYAAIRRTSDAWWSDPERHRAGRQDMFATRRMLVGRAFEELGLDAADAVAVADSYSRVRLDAMYLLPGAAETLSALRRAGLRLALLTNGDSETQRWKIRRFGLDGAFDAILVEGELGFGKPDPRAYAEALSRLGVGARDACMVGDNLEWDVAAPQRAGIRAVWVDRRGAGLPAGAAVAPYRVIPAISRLRVALAADLAAAGPRFAGR